MLSIGLLGFIVWSFFMMALPFSDKGVINFAICWNSFMLISTLNSPNLINYTQSAGKIRIYRCFNDYSSETIRKKSDIDPNWLNWFIGFTEGDGALLNYKNQLRFVLTQKEGDILYHIQSIFNFGTVKYYPNGFYRFIVTDTSNILKLIKIFNGNLVLPYRILQLSLWIQILKTKNIKVDDLIETPKSISLLDSWLSGFTDAEGCFNVQITSRKESQTGYRIRLRFILDQKNAKSLFINISNLFSYGFVSLRSNTKYNNIFRFTINSFSGIPILINYFNSFPLKTFKKESYNKWLIVYNMILDKEHLTEEGLVKIKKLSKQINIHNSLTKKIGSR